LTAGQYVNIYDSGGGVWRTRKAKAAAGFQCYGWVDANVSNGATATVRFIGRNTRNSGLTPGPVFLSATPGLVTNTCPSGAGAMAQQLGVATSATDVDFEWQPAVLLAATHAVGVVTGGFTKSIVLTATGTLNIPTGVTAGRITMVAAGGGGSSRTGALGGGGGGAGEAVVDQPIEVVSGAAYAVTIGAGGTGGNAAGGTDGTDTILVAVQTWTVKGGKGGTSVGGGGAGGGMSGGSGGGGASSPGGAGSAGAAEHIAFYSGSGGGGGSNTTGSGGGVGAPSGGMNVGATAGTTLGAQGGGGSGASTIYGLGGAGGNGGSAGTNAPSTSYGAGGGGAGGVTASSAFGGRACDGYFMFEYVG
jgi:hypothetical protein